MRHVMNKVTLGKYKAILNYFEILKPRESSLHFLMGVIAALIAANGSLENLQMLVLIIFAIACGITGANGLTNYLDRNIDIKMHRTCLRVLPSKRIYPSEQ